MKAVPEKLRSSDPEFLKNFNENELTDEKLFKKGNKVVVHIIVLLTFLLIFALSMPFKARMEAEDTLGMARVGLMIATSIVAMVIYVKSFIDARKARQAG